MEEVRRRLVQFDLPAAKTPIHNPETGYLMPQEGWPLV